MGSMPSLAATLVQPVGQCSAKVPAQSAPADAPPAAAMTSLPQRPVAQRPQKPPAEVIEAAASARTGTGQPTAPAAPAANLSTLHNLAALGSLNRSAFAPVAPMFPEVQLWSQLNSMLVAGAAAAQPGAGELIAYQANLAAQGAAARNGRSCSGEGSKSSSAYASR